MEFSGKCLLHYPRKKGGRRSALLHSEQVQEFIKISCKLRVSGAKTRDVAEPLTPYAFAFTLTDHIALDTSPCCNARRVF